MAKPNDDDNNDTLHTQGLSEEEIAALANDDADDDAADLAAIAEDDDDDVADAAADETDDELDDDDDEDADAAAVKDKAADANATAKPATEAAATTDALDSDDDTPEFRTVYQVDPVENFDQKMADFDAQKKALRAQFTDGEIDIDKYEEQKDAITAQEQALREQNLKYTISVEQNEQNARAKWEWEQDRFFEAEANVIYKNKLVMASLDTAVKDLAAKPENANRPAAWFLKEGDRLVREAMGLTAGPADKKKDPPANDKRKPDLTKIPPNLGALPAAEVAETGSGEFAYLENLDGIKLEQALAKLTPEQQARYLEAA